MMKNKCLYCYQPIDHEGDYHEKCAAEFFGLPSAPTLDYSLDEMEKLAQQTVARSVTIPGVQPKLSLSINKQPKDTRLTIVGALGGQYILKPPTDMFPELPQNEHVTMRIAESFGIRVVPSSLIRLASGELAYITKRIDRTDGGDKIHMLDMFQITEAFDKYRSSVERIGKAINSYSSNPLLDGLYFFEVILFSFLTGNNDMHLKNFSMIRTPIGWELTPAYDLLNVSIALPEDTEELALTLSGKKRKLTKNHFHQFALDLGLTPKQIEGVFNRFASQKDNAIKWVEQSFLSKEMKEDYVALLEERYGRVVEL